MLRLNSLIRNQYKIKLINQFDTTKIKFVGVVNKINLFHSSKNCCGKSSSDYYHKKYLGSFKESPQLHNKLLRIRQFNNYKSLNNEQGTKYILQGSKKSSVENKMHRKSKSYFMHTARSENNIKEMNQKINVIKKCKSDGRISNTNNIGYLGEKPFNIYKQLKRDKHNTEFQNLPKKNNNNSSISKISDKKPGNDSDKILCTSNSETSAKKYLYEVDNLNDYNNHNVLKNPRLKFKNKNDVNNEKSHRLKRSDKNLNYNLHLSKTKHSGFKKQSENDDLNSLKASPYYSINMKKNTEIIHKARSLPTSNPPLIKNTRVFKPLHFIKHTKNKNNFVSGQKLIQGANKSKDLKSMRTIKRGSKSDILKVFNNTSKPNIFEDIGVKELTKRKPVGPILKQNSCKFNSISPYRNGSSKNDEGKCTDVLDIKHNMKTHFNQNKKNSLHPVQETYDVTKNSNPVITPLRLSKKEKIKQTYNEYQRNVEKISKPVQMDSRKDKGSNNNVGLFIRENGQTNFDNHQYNMESANDLMKLNGLSKEMIFKISSKNPKLKKKYPVQNTMSAHRTRSLPHSIQNLKSSKSFDIIKRAKSTDNFAPYSKFITVSKGTKKIEKNNNAGIPKVRSLKEVNIANAMQIHNKTKEEKANTQYNVKKQNYETLQINFKSNLEYLNKKSNIYLKSKDQPNHKKAKSEEVKKLVNHDKLSNAMIINMGSKTPKVKNKIPVKFSMSACRTRSFPNSIQNFKRSSKSFDNIKRAKSTDNLAFNSKFQTVSKHTQKIDIGQNNRPDNPKIENSSKLNTSFKKENIVNTIQVYNKTKKDKASEKYNVYKKMSQTSQINLKSNLEYLDKYNNIYSKSKDQQNHKKPKSEEVGNLVRHDKLSNAMILKMGSKKPKLNKKNPVQFTMSACRTRSLPYSIQNLKSSKSFDIIKRAKSTDYFAPSSKFKPVSRDTNKMEENNSVDFLKVQKSNKLKDNFKEENIVNTIQGYNKTKKEKTSAKYNVYKKMSQTPQMNLKSNLEYLDKNNNIFSKSKDQPNNKKAKSEEVGKLVKHDKLSNAMILKMGSKKPKLNKKIPVQFTMSACKTRSLPYSIQNLKSSKSFDIIKRAKSTDNFATNSKFKTVSRVTKKMEGNNSVDIPKVQKSNELKDNSKEENTVHTIQIHKQIKEENANAKYNVYKKKYETSQMDPKSNLEPITNTNNVLYLKSKDQANHTNSRTEKVVKLMKHNKLSNKMIINMGSKNPKAKKKVPVKFTMSTCKLNNFKGIHQKKTFLKTSEHNKSERNNKLSFNNEDKITSKKKAMSSENNEKPLRQYKCDDKNNVHNENNTKTTPQKSISINSMQNIKEKKGAVDLNLNTNSNKNNTQCEDIRPNTDIKDTNMDVLLDNEIINNLKKFKTPVRTSKLLGFCNQSHLGDANNIESKCSNINSYQQEDDKILVMKPDDLKAKESKESFYSNDYNKDTNKSECLNSSLELSKEKNEKCMLKNDEFILNDFNLQKKQTKKYDSSKNAKDVENQCKKSLKSETNNKNNKSNLNDSSSSKLPFETKHLSSDDNYGNINISHTTSKHKKIPSETETLKRVKERLNSEAPIINLNVKKLDNSNSSQIDTTKLETIKSNYNHIETNPKLSLKKNEILCQSTKLNDVHKNPYSCASTPSINKKKTILETKNLSKIENDKKHVHQNIYVNNYTAKNECFIYNENNTTKNEQKSQFPNKGSNIATICSKKILNPELLCYPEKVFTTCSSENVSSKTVQENLKKTENNRIFRLANKLFNNDGHVLTNEIKWDDTFWILCAMSKSKINNSQEKDKFKLGLENSYENKKCFNRYKKNEVLVFGEDSRIPPLPVFKNPSNNYHCNVPHNIVDKLPKRIPSDNTIQSLSEDHNLHSESKTDFKNGDKNHKNNCATIKNPPIEEKINSKKLNSVIKPQLKSKKSPSVLHETYTLENNKRSKLYYPLVILKIKEIKLQDIPLAAQKYPLIGDIVKHISSKIINANNTTRRHEMNIKQELRFQEQLQKVLKGKNLTNNNLELLNSLKWTWPFLSSISVVNSHTMHPKLFYRGIIGCTAKFRNHPVAIEWKLLNKPEDKLNILQDTALQLSATIGALNYDRNYNFQVNKGVIILGYASGDPADVFFLSPQECLSYWNMWLTCLKKYSSKRYTE